FQLQTKSRGNVRDRGTGCGYAARRFPRRSRKRAAATGKAFSTAGYRWVEKWESALPDQFLPGSHVSEPRRVIHSRKHPGRKRLLPPCIQFFQKSTPPFR